MYIVTDIELKPLNITPPYSSNFDFLFYSYNEENNKIEAKAYALELCILKLLNTDNLDKEITIKGNDIFKYNPLGLFKCDDIYALFVMSKYEWLLSTAIDYKGERSFYEYEHYLRSQVVGTVHELGLGPFSGLHYKDGFICSRDNYAYIVMIEPNENVCCFVSSYIKRFIRKYGITKFDGDIFIVPISYTRVLEFRVVNKSLFSKLILNYEKGKV